MSPREYRSGVYKEWIEEKGRKKERKIERNLKFGISLLNVDTFVVLWLLHHRYAFVGVDGLLSIGLCVGSHENNWAFTDREPGDVATPLSLSLSLSSFSLSVL
jgi:hypothetical protein